jgi:pectate lyase
MSHRLRRLCAVTACCLVPGGAGFAASSSIDSAYLGAVAAAGALPAPSCAVSTQRSAKLMSAMYGFAAAANTTGGAASAFTYTVTRADVDNVHTAGTLRWAVAQAAQAGGGWITFADLGGQWISLYGDISLPSNITIDGGCNGVNIQTTVNANQCSPTSINGSLQTVCSLPNCINCSPAVFIISGSSNVIITNIHFRPDPTAIFSWETTQGGVAESGDCITVNRDDTHPGADKIWIAYNTFESCHDGLLDITEYNSGDPRTLPPMRITLAYNHFLNHDKDSGVNGGLCPPAGYGGVPAWCTLFPGGSPSPQTQSETSGVLLTLQGNLYDGTAARHPRVQGLVYLHMMDNIIAYQQHVFPITTNGNWQGTTESVKSTGAEVLGGARVYGRNNFYFALDNATYLPSPIAVTHAADATYPGVIDNGAANTDASPAHVLPANAPVGDYNVNAAWVAPPLSYSAGTPQMSFGATQSAALGAVTCLAYHVGAGASFAAAGEPSGCGLAGPDSQ